MPDHPAEEQAEGIAIDLAFRLGHDLAEAAAALDGG